MKTKSILIMCFSVVLSLEIQAQSPEVLAKSAMLNAEEAYSNNQYSECIEFLKDAEKNIGKTNSAIEYLKVKSLVALGVKDEYNKTIWLQADKELKQFFNLTPEGSYIPEKYDEMLLLVTKVKKYLAEAELGSEGRNIINFTEVIKKDPTNKEAYYYRANNYFRLNKYTEAIQDYTKAIELEPDSGVQYYWRGYAKYHLNDSSGAINDYIHSIELGYRNENIYVKLITNESFFDNVDKELFYEHYNNIITMTSLIITNPKEGTFYFGRANSKVALLDYQGAIQDYTKAIELHLKYKLIQTFCYTYLGSARMKMNDFDGAILDYTKAIEIYSKNQNAFFWRGRVYQSKLHNIQAANSDFENVIKFNDDKILTAFSYYYIGQKDKAFNLINDLIKKGKDDRLQNFNYYNLACLYSLDGNKAEALKSLKIAFDKGFNRFCMIKNEEDFDNIRNSVEFIDLIKKYKK